MTLVTCTPYGINTHRLLVHAERADVPAEWANRDKDQAPTNGPASVAETPLLPFTLVGLAVGLGVLVAWLLAKRRREREAVGFTPALDAYKRGKHARGRGPRG